MVRAAIVPRNQKTTMHRTTWFGPEMNPTREGCYEIMTWFPDQVIDEMHVSTAYWFNGKWWWDDDSPGPLLRTKPGEACSRLSDERRRV